MPLKIALIVGVTTTLSGCMDSGHDNQLERYKNATFESEGERLYFTGV